ncbi:MAG: signal recognition particle-docking protein FtsY [Saccharofermentanales bacterium]
MGMLDIFKKGLTKTREFVSDNINRISASLGYFDEEMLDDLETILVQADAGASCSMKLISDLRKSIKEKGDKSKDFVLSTLKEEIRSILGEQKKLELADKKLNIILLVGVNGTGKTTTAGKLCLRFKQQDKKVILAAADTFRAAAIDQLKHWGDRTQTPVIAHEEGSDPASVVFDAVHAAIARNADVLIIDTAGRLHNKQNLMDELAKIRRIITREAGDSAQESLLVIDATTGQNAINQAKEFSKVTDVTGIVITKLDSNAKGGVAIAVSYETHIPIVLAGLGEKAEDLVDFDPESFVESLF